MNTTPKFRAYEPDDLPHLEFASTKDEAIADALARSENTARELIVEQVRDPVLSDFLVPMDLISSLREAMAARIGNDDALSDGAVVERLLAAATEDITAVLDDAAERIDLRIDGFLVVQSWNVITKVDGDNGDL